jgi:hypothetical protein
MADALAAMAIWPEGYGALAARPFDVLVMHGVSSSHLMGVVAIEQPARAMGVSLICTGTTM